jgi:hypothetical protein
MTAGGENQCPQLGRNRWPLTQEPSQTCPPNLQMQPGPCTWVAIWSRLLAARPTKSGVSTLVILLMRGRRFPKTEAEAAASIC